MKGDRLTQTIVANRIEVLVVRSTQVTGPMLSADGLRLVVRAGAGFDTIDIQASKTHQVYVANCPGQNAIAVAELSFGLMLSLDRHIPNNVEDLREGRWNNAKLSFSSKQVL